MPRKEDYCGLIFAFLLISSIIGLFAWVDHYRETRSTKYAALLMEKGDATLEVSKIQLMQIPIDLLNGITVTSVEDGKVSLAGSGHNLAYIFKLTR